MKDRPANIAIIAIGLLLGVMLILSPVPARGQALPADDFMEIIRTLADFKDRSSGTAGSRASAAYIRERFTEIGLESVGSLFFDNTVLSHRKSILTLAGKDIEVPIAWLHSNAISPESTPEQGLSGPLVYVGDGDIGAFNGKPIEGAILLMEFDSGRNWLHAASLGAKALIYVDRETNSAKALFQEKLELTPIRFPRFWMPIAQARALFGHFEASPGPLVSESVGLTATNQWETATGENVYGLIPGSDPKLSEELLILEAFYDSRTFVAGLSPGADAACGIATLLQTARRLMQSPPARSILIVATDGHAQALAGMREMIWGIRERTKELRQIQKDLRQSASAAQKRIRLLKAVSTASGWLEKASDGQTGIEMKAALDERIKTEIDILSRELMRLRLKKQAPEIENTVKALAGERLALRRLSWLPSFSNLAEADRRAVAPLIAKAMKDEEAVLSDANRQQKCLRSVNTFRSLVKSRELAAFVSLHLSSHGDGIGAFNQGWLYPLKPGVDRVNAYSRLDEVLRQAASDVQKASGLQNMYKDTLRPSRLRPWESYFLDRPPLGGEVSSLAGY
ncbi:MAG: M28 family peptidase, partial [Desulfobacteraceae bacterium]